MNTEGKNVIMHTDTQTQTDTHVPHTQILDNLLEFIPNSIYCIFNVKSMLVTCM